MAKAKKEALDLEQELNEVPEVVELDPNRTQPFELWDISVDFKKEQNPETFEVETIPVITKKGDKPVRITHIEQRHADILNSQAQNSKQYYYPKS
jgi:hypothetical protein